MDMKRKYNLRLARVIQWISGALAFIVIYPVFRLIYPCWRRLKGVGNLQETGVPRSSGPSGPHCEPSAKSIPQGK